jgi:hypothetical protein
MLIVGGAHGHRWSPLVLEQVHPGFGIVHQLIELARPQLGVAALGADVGVHVPSRIRTGLAEKARLVGIGTSDGCAQRSGRTTAWT